MLAILGFGCSSPSSSTTIVGLPTEGENDGERVQLVTTLYPLEFFANYIGGDLVEVKNLVAPGVEAHDFEPSTHHMRLMRSADMILFNGAGFEPWMERALNGLNDDPRVVVEAAFGLVDEHKPEQNAVDSDEHLDPHVWLDLGNAARQAEKIRDALIQIAPDHQNEIQTNAENLLNELTQLDAEFRDGVKDCRMNTFVTSHSAFGHLADKYGLVQVPISGLSPESEPSPGTLADLIVEIKNTGVDYVLAESTGSKRLSVTVAAEIGAEILPIHPLESLTPEQAANGADFISLMRENLTSLIVALECSQ
jgi:zinc transport system substrate-binding protein